MFSADLHFNRLAAVQFITDNGFGHIICFILCFFLEQGFAVFGVKGFVGEPDVLAQGKRLLLEIRN